LTDKKMSTETKSRYFHNVMEFIIAFNKIRWYLYGLTTNSNATELKDIIECRIQLHNIIANFFARALNEWRAISLLSQNIRISSSSIAPTNNITTAPLAPMPSKTMNNTITTQTANIKYRPLECIQQFLFFANEYANYSKEISNPKLSNLQKFKIGQSNFATIYKLADELKQECIAAFPDIGTQQIKQSRQTNQASYITKITLPDDEKLSPEMQITRSCKLIHALHKFIFSKKHESSSFFPFALACGTSLPDERNISLAKRFSEIKKQSLETLFPESVHSFPWETRLQLQSTKDLLVFMDFLKDITTMIAVQNEVIQHINKRKADNCARENDPELLKTTTNNLETLTKAKEPLNEIVSFFKVYTHLSNTMTKTGEEANKLLP
jgi:hypothetical protein